MSPNHYTYSKDGLALTERNEGCRLTAYQDQRGVWTIGYGHTGVDVRSGLTVTQHQAEALLAADVTSAGQCVNACVQVPISQAEFDALTDFVFNLGQGAFRTSTLLKELNAGNFAAAALQFEGWDRCAGMVCAGLLRRRSEEVALFTLPADGPATGTASGAGTIRV